MMIRTLVPLALLVALSGCKRASEKTETPQDEAGTTTTLPAAAPAGARFSEDLEKKDCELLTAAMVSRVSGVAEADLKSSTPGGWCHYEGGGVTAMIKFLDVGKDAKSKADRFANAYQNKTGEQVAEDMKKVKAQVDKEQAAGAIDKGTARKAKALGGVIAAGPLSSGFQYEDIKGPWDKAMLETSERVVKIGSREIKNYANTLQVLVSNMSFAVEYQTREPKLHREELIKLASEITKALPQ